MTSAAGRDGVPGSSFGLTLVLTVEAGDWPDEERLRALCETAIDASASALGLEGTTELGVLFTDDARIRALNARWRGSDKATNVLSFPASPMASKHMVPPLLGDIAVAYETILREAELEKKPFDHHLIHLVIHGFLHLVGYDHRTDAEADEMEAIERGILAMLAIPDPYAVTDQGE